MVGRRGEGKGKGVVVRTGPFGKQRGQVRARVGKKKDGHGWWWERGFGTGSKSKSSAKPEAESQKGGEGQKCGRGEEGRNSLPVLPGSVTVVRILRFWARLSKYTTHCRWVEMLVGGVWLLKFLTRLIPLTATTTATATAFGGRMTWPISDSGLRQPVFFSQSVSQSVGKCPFSARTDACRNLTSPCCQIILLEVHWLAAEFILTHALHGGLTFT